MRINVAVPEAHVDAPVLDAALEAVTRLDESMLKSGEIPTLDRGLRYGVRWHPEPPGAEHFDHGGLVIGRRWGDCDDLAPWHAASLRHTGEDPGAQAFVRRSGPSTWHALVRRSDGTIDDPSKRAGMGENHPGVRGAWLPLMSTLARGVNGAYMLRPQIALRPIRGVWQARADLPWHWREHLSDAPSSQDWAMTALHMDPIASTALTGAIEGACELGLCAGTADEDHINRVCAIADACDGATHEELVETYGHEHAQAAAQVVGSFWSGLARTVEHALPIASKAVQFVPGIGPVASTAMDFAAQHFPHLHSGSAAMMPGAFQAPSHDGSGFHLQMHCVPFS